MTTTTDLLRDHKAAETFFEKMRTHFISRIPSRDEVTRQIQVAVAEAKISKFKKDRSKAFPEGAFLNLFVLPQIHCFLKNEFKFQPDQARHALLSESYRSCRKFASGTPASVNKHPFTKALGTTAQSVVFKWWDKSPHPRVSQSCPDLALREPCPYRVVFEAKYFRDGGPDAAKTALVTGIYQCFYYLGLPRVPVIKKRASWDYDFSCLLIYDGSKGQSVSRAWDEVQQDVNKGCWEGANIYVMILPHPIGK